MLTALKKKLGPPSPSTPSSSSGVHRMSAGLQRRFGRGVRFNLKVLIRGDRAVGKSALIRRLEGFQGHEDSSSYVASESIGVASIHWTPDPDSSGNGDVVKVEVWDVVDKGRKRVPLVGLKIDNNEVDNRPNDSNNTSNSNAGSNNEGVGSSDFCLDAEFVDVYKGSHGVVFLFDVTKAWTLDYVIRQLVDVPAHLPILVLANFIDRAHHRVVTADVAKMKLDEASRVHGVNIRYAESSMTNGFGLRYLHRFLLLPFLHMQKQSLLAQLDANLEHTERTREQLSSLELEQDYEAFSKELNSKRRDQAAMLAPKATSDLVIGAQQGLEKQSNGQINLNNLTKKSDLSGVKEDKERKEDDVDGVKESALTNGNGLKNHLAGTGDASTLSSVDEFIPPSMDNSFLVDEKSTNFVVDYQNDESDDDDDDTTENPMVAKVHDDVEDEDEKVATESKAEYEEI